MQRTMLLAGLLLLLFATQYSLAHDADCYPENRAVLTAVNSDSGTDEIGPTFASGSAPSLGFTDTANSGKFEEIEADIRGTPTNLGGASVSLSFATNINGANTVASPGTSKGQLKLTITWNDPSKTGGVKVTTFTSGCVAEIQTAHQDGFKYVGEMEAELEGGVENFPFYPRTIKAAVASVVAKEDPDNPGRVEVDVSLELGYTCNENIYAGGEDIELEKIVFKNQHPSLFKINNTGNHTLFSQPMGCTGQ